MGRSELENPENTGVVRARHENVENSALTVCEVQSQDLNRANSRRPKAENDGDVTRLGLAGANDLLPADFRDNGRRLSDLSAAQKKETESHYKATEQDRNPYESARPGEPARNESGQIVGVRYENGSGMSIQRDPAGTITEATHFNSSGKPDQSYKADRDNNLDLKEDGSLVKSTFRTNLVAGDTIYDRTGKEIGHRSSESRQHYQTETIRPDGSRTIDNHNNHTTQRFDKEGAQLLTDNVRFKSGRYLVAGPDGQEREFVESEKYEQTTGLPTRANTPGGKIDNESSKPILAVGKGPGYPGNEHGDGFLRVIKLGASTDAAKTDFDGLVPDAKFQPVTLPDGRILMPKSVPAEASWIKLRDSYTATVKENDIAKNSTSSGDLSVESPNFTSRFGVYHNQKIGDYTGGVSAKPQIPGHPKADRSD